MMHGESRKFPTGVGCLVENSLLVLAELYFGQFTCESADSTHTCTFSCIPVWMRIFDLRVFLGELQILLMR